MGPEVLWSLFEISGFQFWGLGCVMVLVREFKISRCWFWGLLGPRGLRSWLWFNISRAQDVNILKSWDLETFRPCGVKKSRSQDFEILVLVSGGLGSLFKLQDFKMLVLGPWVRYGHGSRFQDFEILVLGPEGVGSLFMFQTFKISRF